VRLCCLVFGFGIVFRGGYPDMDYITHALLMYIIALMLKTKKKKGVCDGIHSSTA